MSVALREPPNVRSFVIRRSTLCSGSPSSALRGITVPDAIVAGPSKRSATPAGMTIGFAVPPAFVRLRRFVATLPYGAPETPAMKPLPQPQEEGMLLANPHLNRDSAA